MALCPVTFYAVVVGERATLWVAMGGGESGENAAHLDEFAVGKIPLLDVIRRAEANVNLCAHGIVGLCERCAWHARPLGVWNVLRGMEGQGPDGLLVVRER